MASHYKTTKLQNDRQTSKNGEYTNTSKTYKK